MLWFVVILNFQTCFLEAYRYFSAIAFLVASLHTYCQSCWIISQLHSFAFLRTHHIPLYIYL